MVRFRFCNSKCWSVFLLTVATWTIPTTARTRQVLLVANDNNGMIGQYAKDGSTINASFAYDPDLSNVAMVLDGSNHLFVSTGAGRVRQYDATTGTQLNPAFIQGLTLATGLALDRHGHLFVASFGPQKVGEYDAVTGAVLNANFITTAQGLLFPWGLAVDHSNHLFVGNAGVVGEYDAITGATINASFIAGLNVHGHDYLAIDTLNHLFVADENAVGEYDATTGAPLNATFISGAGLNNPVGLAIQGNRLYVANVGNNTVGEYDATTGDTINTTLINGQGLNGPVDLVFIPEPSFSWLAMAVILFRIGSVRIRGRSVAQTSLRTKAPCA
jgi:hypothetical protein